MIKYRKITDISLVTDIRYQYTEKPISTVPIRHRYRYIDIGDISTIFSTHVYFALPGYVSLTSDRTAVGPQNASTSGRRPNP